MKITLNNLLCKIKNSKIGKDFIIYFTNKNFQHNEIEFEELIIILFEEKQYNYINLISQIFNDKSIDDINVLESIAKILKTQEINNMNPVFLSPEYVHHYLDVDDIKKALIRTRRQIYLEQKGIYSCDIRCFSEDFILIIETLLHISGYSLCYNFIKHFNISVVIIEDIKVSSRIFIKNRMVFINGDLKEDRKIEYFTKINNNNYNIDYDFVCSTAMFGGNPYKAFLTYKEDKNDIVITFNLLCEKKASNSLKCCFLNFDFYDNKIQLEYFLEILKYTNLKNKKELINEINNIFYVKKNEHKCSLIQALKKFLENLKK